MNTNTEYTYRVYLYKECIHNFHTECSNRIFRQNVHVHVHTCIQNVLPEFTCTWIGSDREYTYKEYIEHVYRMFKQNIHTEYTYRM